MDVSKYCSACGNGLIETAAICPKCGSPVQGASLPGVARSKSKNVAVLLAVFLGFWTYLYTFAKDKTKFWITLAISSVASITAIVSLAIASDRSTKYSNCILGSFDWTYGGSNYDIELCDMYKVDYTLTYVAWIIQLGLLIFVIVDRARKPKSYFENYPN